MRRKLSKRLGNTGAYLAIASAPNYVPALRQHEKGRSSIDLHLDGRTISVSTLRYQHSYRSLGSDHHSLAPIEEWSDALVVLL